MSIITTKDKYKLLLDNLKELEPFVIAFSGGVDSTFLTAAAKEAGVEFEAVTVNTPFVPEREIQAVEKLVQELEFKHQQLKIEFNELGKALENKAERCYDCKKIIFNQIIDYAAGKTVIEGSNLDDTGDYRPGRRALKELNVKSPLLAAQLTKKEIRILSKELGLATWNKPSLSCLATRISYGNQITAERLEKIEIAEELLRRNGFHQFRVRDHDNLARIELSETDRKKILDLNLMDKLSDKLQKLGFQYVTLDLSAYQSGSMNKEILEGKDE
ncbi:MAG: ATP-dependent sacrificial sulfur transferase LarE [Bacillota bacterium]